MPNHDAENALLQEKLHEKDLSCNPRRWEENAPSPEKHGWSMRGGPGSWKR